MERIHCPDCNKVLAYNIDNELVCMQHKDGRSREHVRGYFPRGYFRCICGTYSVYTDGKIQIDSTLTVSRDVMSAIKEAIERTEMAV